MATIVDKAFRPTASSSHPGPTDESITKSLLMQQTIASPVAVAGFGFWSGKDVHVEFRPAAPDQGIAFVRGDSVTPAVIPARIQNRVETPRRTTLTSNGASVEMVEHVLAALSGLGIDNCEVWTDGSEMPGCDGSSLAFVKAIESVGAVPQNAPRRKLVIRETTRIGDSDHWIEARPSRDGVFSIRYRLDYSESTAAIGRQTASFKISPDVFRHELAPSRTFMLEAEAQWLLAQGLGTRVKATDVLVFNDTGPIDNQLRFEDECVRHKILDVIGDLALADCQIQGEIIAHRSGHRLNAELVKVLLQEGEVVQPERSTG